MDFEQFLEEKYDEIDNDSNNMNEAFENRRSSWFENLDIQEVMDFAQEYGKLKFEEGKQYIHQQIANNK